MAQLSLHNPVKQVIFDTFGYKPHDGQIAAHNLADAYPNVTVVCGRQFGKSTFAIYEALFQSLQDTPDGRPPIIYIVSDTYDHSNKIYKPLEKLFTTDKNLTKRLDKKDAKNLRLILKSGAEIHAKSSDSPQSLVGDSVSFAIIEESGLVPDEAIKYLEPALWARPYARRINIGTPDRSDTWFKHEFERGLSEDSDSGSMQKPSWVNPLITEKIVERERKKLKEDDFRKYMLAEFVDFSENPFAQLVTEAELVPEMLPPIPGHTYVAGVDLADRADFTAVVVVDVTEKPHKVVHVEKWNGTGYEVTGRKVAELLKRFNYASGYADRTGVGDAAIPHITTHYGNIEPVVFTLQEKQTMFDTVFTALEKKELMLLDNSTLLQELRTLKAIQRTRGVSYEAPKGMHDDVAMALFLAGRGLNRESFYVPSGLEFTGYQLSL